ncbi:MAG: LysR family transcriptional regulator, partial [Thiohalobacterales bacterium]|nr:LysR family transcriptional regulator [Thiohalobacterales bacterium]
MDRFADIEAYVAVVETGSFSAASERLGIAKSVVSRRVSQLERRLGSRLLNRTTRRLSQTDSGRLFFERAVRILSDLDDAEQSIAAETGELRGRIKLAGPLSFGLRHLADELAVFLDRYPEIDLTLDLNDRQVNLVEEGFDMAVRIGALADSTLTARTLGVSRAVTAASPAYLQQHGIPRHPDDLRSHQGLQYTHITARQQWRFLDADGRSHHAQPRVRIRANNGEALAAAAVAG